MDILAVDVGAGTQDIFLYQDEIPLEGSTKAVLPSQTVVVAGRIDQARLQGRDIFLLGPTMGGGASTSAIRRHLSSGLKVYATSSAAATVNDDLSRVASMGVIIQDQAPPDAVGITTGDIDLPALESAFGQFGVSLPKDIAVAVQDHGFSPGRSNRLVRFEYLASKIKAGGRLESFGMKTPPGFMTRMNAVKVYLQDREFRPFLMDTGPAALLGATLDPRFKSPALVINFGNGHTIAAIVDDTRVMALFEHHTSDLTPDKLRLFLDRFCRGTLTNSEIFDDGGHGAYIEEAEKVRSVLVTGPRRESFIQSGAMKDLGQAIAAAPGGDMMITGCLGLIEAWRRS
ncbi:MAG TPA: DUF1786 domain-containing protein [Methanotrichaceae archaeon]|nr:DUF1786 domain-containing protein [Methanotrichaceae archaeon]